MIGISRIKTAVPADWRISALLLLYTVIFTVFLRGYVQWSSFNFFIGLITLPFVLESATGKPSGMFGYLALFFGLFYFLLPLKVSLFLAASTAILFLFESVRGRTSLNAFVVLVLMAPQTKYLADIYSFPIRLKLTWVAGKVLALFGRDVSVSGNVITWKSTDFSVDPACMGMHMLVSSMLCAILILSIRQKQCGRQLGFQWIPLLLLFTILLNAVANLIRIVLLVLFHIMPETIGHDLVGMTTLIIYVMLPLIAVMPLLLRFLGREVRNCEAEIRKPDLKLHGALVLLILIAASFAPKVHERPFRSLPAVNGYRASFFDKDIVKLQNEQALIYIKDLKSFYGADHSPLLCWTGKGYLFKQVEEADSGDGIIRGTLVKDKDVLYTAWWYSHGEKKAGSNLRWRWESLRDGSESYIVNITTSDEADLQGEIDRILADQNLRKWMVSPDR